MDEKKLLNDEQLEDVVGGVSHNDALGAFISEAPEDVANPFLNPDGSNFNDISLQVIHRDV